MQVTGYVIREAIKRRELRRATLATQAKQSLWRFEGDSKLGADEAMFELAKSEKDIALLQTYQDRYNLAVNLSVKGEEMTLSQAVKLVGGAGRVEKQWRDFATDTGKRGYGDESLTRTKDEERATRTLSVMECLTRSNTAAGFAGNLRAAIAEANAKKIEFNELDASLFD